MSADPLLRERLLPNGLRLLVSPMPAVRSVTVSFYVGAGARYETPAEAGISHLVEHCCFKGSARRPTARLISEAIEGVGGVLNAGTDRELTVYYAKAPSAHLDLALDVVLDLAIRPTFDLRELEKERQVILEELAMIEDNPGEIAELALDELLWPNSALGRDVAGTPASVRAIARERAVAYHRDQYVSSNALLSVAGDVDLDTVADLVMRHSTPWESGSPGDWVRLSPSAPGGPRVGLRAKPTEQANVMIGLPGVSFEHPDRYALDVLASVLGEGMSSRLFIELREELSLAYDVHAYSHHLRDTGALNIFLGVDPDNIMPALDAALRQLALLHDGISDAELHKIREYSKGRLILGMEDTRAVSAWYGGQALLLGRPHSMEEVIARLEAVTREDLARVAHDYIREDRLHLAVVGPFESADPFRQALHF